MIKRNQILAQVSQNEPKNKLEESVDKKVKKRKRVGFKTEDMVTELSNNQ